MIKKIAFLVSFTSLIILLTPATIPAIIIAGAINILVMGYVVRTKKDFKYIINNIILKFTLACILMVMLGVKFYERWICSSMIKSIANLLHMSNNTLIIICAIIFGFLGSYYVIIVLEFTIRQLERIPNNIRLMVMTIGTAVLINYMPQFMLGIIPLNIGIINYMMGAIIVIAVMLFLFIVSNNFKKSLILTIMFFMLWSTANAYICSFRGYLLEPIDFLSIRTALNVANNDRFFPVPMHIIIGWGIAGILMIYLTVIPITNKEKKTRKVAGLLFVVAVGCVTLYTNNLKPSHWEMDGAKLTGYYLDFMTKIKEIKVKKPDNYDARDVELLTEKYEGIERNESNLPHIIVIMDEAFSNIENINKIETNIDVMPYISSLNEDIIKGYALTSVYGGYTANSEFEFLTSNTMAWLPKNTVPYQQYLKGETYSMVSYLKSAYDYKCIAMHPYHASGWNRTNIYSQMGFDEWMFLEEFSQHNLCRQYVSDTEMFKKLIEIYEENSVVPTFLFGITMQNHGGYEYEGDNFEQSIVLMENPGQYPQVEQYLSCINETDKAVEMLVEHFKAVEENVVIVFFGDHLPNLEDDFYTKLNGGDFDSIEEQQLKYTVPFFVWTNYDIEEQFDEFTSLNYLANYMYEVAGISMPTYNQVLNDIEEFIPAINANGFYSKTDDCFKNFDDANEDEKKLLNMYEQIQYNNMFDLKNRNEVMFPVVTVMK